MNINNNYELPPIPPSFQSNDSKFQTFDLDKLTKNMQNQNIVAIPGCKYRLPCGRCEMTKEICTNM